MNLQAAQVPLSTLTAALAEDFAVANALFGIILIFFTFFVFLRMFTSTALAIKVLSFLVFVCLLFGQLHAGILTLCITMLYSSALKFFGGIVFCIGLFMLLMGFIDSHDEDEVFNHPVWYWFTSVLFVYIGIFLFVAEKIFD